MGNTKYKILGSVLILLIVMTFTGCEKISQGQQRLKFEFLYKLNNYATILREYTGSISYQSDLDTYIRRMEKLFGDVNKMETIDGYGASRTLKEDFLTIVDANLNSARGLMQRDGELKENIRKEYDVIIMEERVDKFIEVLNDEIVAVGKE